MQTEPSHPPTLDDHAIEQTILGLLLGNPQLWAVEEIVREIGDRLAVSDALRRLQAGGLVHMVAGEFVFASRVAVRACELWQ